MDVKTGRGGNKNNMDLEKSFFEKFEARYKKMYFWALFVLLKEEDTSLVISLISAFITFLQLQIFPFHPNVSHY
jgi:hypothetical protein